ncbi:tRNA uridine-5-carboxymethylaminomethyl(34) synthesis GTPase MnmE [Sphingomonas sp.]|uniref:tRNA uridine-5-carboxymethylaminomethyl(34) synthesis GTPase MnmE n=1 Tax=Sphingomonas sp. TaxID=28214 RepID=UPI0025E6788C|nr:tRNA uridine-5-carboxymethylaminomethyl(34) synthesis GTPase MnmE [Sphingomonas sp.]
MTHRKTIYALSSGSPPAGIAIIRISGPEALAVLTGLTGKQPPAPRLATMARLRDPDIGLTLDHALVLWFPRSISVTGNDVVELHLHGGRAVVAIVLETLSKQSGLRPAEPGEFTRQAFENGAIDLAEAEGLGDLLGAETEAQRRNAVAQIGGSLTRLAQSWGNDLLRLSALAEAAIDFSDEDDVEGNFRKEIQDGAAVLIADISQKLEQPPAERLFGGIRVAILGPPNAGKSTLFNRLLDRDAAIVSATPGTTRDVIEGSVNVDGILFTFIDTAGIRADSLDSIEKIGIARAIAQINTVDIILALGGWQGDTLVPIVNVSAKSDIETATSGMSISASTGAGMDLLMAEVKAIARSLLPPLDAVALNDRHREILRRMLCPLGLIEHEKDELIIAEHLRLSRRSLGEMTGGNDSEALLDVLFGAFCIGK